jgi:RNA polymerase sigma-70 factor, ECF subfamily
VKRTLPGAALGRAAEAALVALAIFGEDAAFSELVRRRQSWLRNLLRRLCRDPALADDLAQQAFIQAWKSIRTLKSPDAFGAWLRRLAVNTWLAHIRSPSHHDAASLRTDAHADTGWTEPADTLAVGEQLDLDRALARLSAHERLCIVLAYNEGMSHGEISEAASLPLGTVKSHIKRGAEQLRTLLQAYRPTEANRDVR